MALISLSTPGAPAATSGVTGSVIAMSTALSPNTVRVRDIPACRGWCEGGVLNTALSLAHTSNFGQSISAIGNNVDGSDADGLAVNSTTGALAGATSGLTLNGGGAGQGQLRHRPYLWCRYKLHSSLLGQNVFTGMITTPENAASTEPPLANEGVYVQIADGVNGGRFRLGSKQAGIVATYVDTGVTAVVDRLYIVEISFDGTNLISVISDSTSSVRTVHTGPFPPLTTALLGGTSFCLARESNFSAQLGGVTVKFYGGGYEQDR